MSRRLTLVYTCWDHPGAGPLPRYEVRRGEDDFELFSVDCSGSDQSDALDAMFFLAVKAGIAEWHPTMRPVSDAWKPALLEAKVVHDGDRQPFDRRESINFPCGVFVWTIKAGVDRENDMGRIRGNHELGCALCQKAPSEAKEGSP